MRAFGAAGKFSDNGQGFDGPYPSHRSVQQPYGDGSSSCTRVRVSEKGEVGESSPITFTISPIGSWVP